MLKLFFAVVIMLFSIAAGLVTAFAAWSTMYSARGHIIVKSGVVLFAVFVVLIFALIGLNGLLAIYD